MNAAGRRSESCLTRVIRSPQSVACSIILAVALLAAAPARPAAGKPLDHVRVQLPWFHQAQFAGIYLARDERLYEREGIAVELIEGGPGINPLEALTHGRADVAVSWLSGAINARKEGRDFVNIAQIFRRSGMAIVCRRDAGVRNSADVAGKSIGVWNVGDELDVRHWLNTIGISSERVTLVQQRADGLDLIEGRVPCVTAMLYNEFWSILRSGLKHSDLLIIRLADSGLGSLEDGLYVTAAALADPRRRDVLVRFLRATLEGWARAKEKPEEAYAVALAAAPRADAVHQRRMLESILQLVGDDKRVGLLDISAYEHSVNVMAGDERGDSSIRLAAANGWTHAIWNVAKPGGRRFLELSASTRYYLSEAVRSRWFYVLELIGTAAFGFAGFMRAQRRNYDLWGAFVLTLLPAVGGGTLRDALIGGERYPPYIFKDPAYLYTVLLTVAAGALLSRFLTEKTVASPGFERVRTVFDTAGLAAFVIIGAEVALVAGLHWIWVPLCAALTCAGGGTLMEVVSGREPRTFQGEPYEEIAIVGALLLLLGLHVADRFEHAPWIVIAVMAITMVAVFAARLIVVSRGIRLYRLGEQRT